MAKQKVKVLLNIGLDDQERYAIPAANQDDVIDVTEKQADVMIRVLQVAKPYNAQEEAAEEERVRAFDESVMEGVIAQEQIRDELKESVRAKMKSGGPRAMRRPPASRNVEGEGEQDGSEDEEGDSPVADMNVPDAVDKISRMTSRSKSKLETIATTDERQGVRDAAEKRLQELG